MNGYELSRAFWDFSFENPEKIKPTHIGIYFFAIEHCNRLGWKKKFGFPTSMALEAIGVKSYSVFKKAFDELVSFGFIEVVEYSKNQYSSNIIALKENCKAHSKAHSKAVLKRVPKHSESTGESTVSIDKPNNLITKEPITYRRFAHLSISVSDFEKLKIDNTPQEIDNVLDSIENYKNNKNYTSLYLTAKKWLKKDKEKSSGQKESIITTAQNLD